MRIKILGKVWNLLFVPASELTARGKSTTDRGDCEHPTKKGKRIRVLKGMDPLEELEVVIHECLHAAEWNMDEDWVDATGGDIAKVLWKLGWRKQVDGNS